MELYEKLASEEDWDRLAEQSGCRFLDTGDGIDVNYFHLAQAHRGRLVEELFRVPVKGPEYVVFESDKSEEQGPWLAHIYWGIGNIARARHAASGCLHSTSGINTPMLEMLAKIELLYGNRKVADKYLRCLHRLRPDFDSTGYHQIREMSVPEMEDSLTAPLDELHAILKSNPVNRVAVEYGLAVPILAKNFRGVYEFVDEFYGIPALKSLPVPVQEVLVLFSDYSRDTEGDGPDMEWCLAHGVSESTVDRFYRFKEAYMAQDGFSLAAYRETFWYYLFFSRS